MKVVGLTGGIASGKSTVSDYFQEKGVPIIDADLVARQVVERGSTGLADIEDQFGSAYIREDGNLDRKKMGSLVFSDDEARYQLEAITHPLIRQRVKDSLTAYREQGVPLVVFDAAILIEAGFEDLVDFLVLVSVPQDVQVDRLKERDGFDSDQALQRIRAQMPLEEKSLLADLVIDNQGTKDSTYRQVDQLLQSLLEGGR